MPYTEVQPTYEAVQWPGDTQEEAAAKLADYYGGAFTTTTHEDDTLELSAGGFTVLIPTGHVYVMGPVYGDLHTGQSELVDDVTFAAKYQVS